MEVVFSSLCILLCFDLFEWKEQNLLTSEFQIPLPLIVNTWKRHSKAAWRHVAEEKTLLAGDTSGHVCLRRLSGDHRTTTQSTQSTQSCYRHHLLLLEWHFFVTNLPCCISLSLYSTVSVFVNTAGAPVMGMEASCPACLTCRSGRGCFLRTQLLGVSGYALLNQLWEKMFEKSLIRTAATNIWKLLTITEYHFTEHGILNPYTIPHRKWDYEDGVIVPTLKREDTFR